VVGTCYLPNKPVAVDRLMEIASGHCHDRGGQAARAASEESARLRARARSQTFMRPTINATRTLSP